MPTESKVLLNKKVDCLFFFILAPVCECQLVDHFLKGKSGQMAESKVQFVPPSYSVSWWTMILPSKGIIARKTQFDSTLLLLIQS